MTFAKVSIDFRDDSIQQPTIPVGVSAIAVQTQRGEPGKVYFMRSWKEWRQNLGEIVDPTDTVGPVIAKRIFDNGGQVFATRILHYSDINDPASFTAVAATGDNSGVFNFSQPIIGVDVPNKKVSIQGDYTDYITLGDVHVVQNLPSGTTSLTVAGTGAVYAGGITTIEYALMILGDAVSGETLTWTSTLVASLNYAATSPGEWANVVTIEIKRAASGIANTLDFFVSSTNNAIVGTDLNEVYRNFPSTPTVGDFDTFNEAMKLLKLVSPVISAPIGVTPPKLLTGGIDDYVSVTEIDYIGSTVANNGLRAFDQESGFVKMAVPEMASNIIDNALLDYVKERKDCLAISRTPESLNAQTAIDYRNATGAYSAGTALDAWQSIMLYGGIKVVSPYEPDNGAELTIPYIGDYLGKSAVKDSTLGAWWNTSGLSRGLLTNVKDIVYNINTPARELESNDLTSAGLCPIIKKKTNGVNRIIMWGDTTLQKASSALSFSNIAELLIYIHNAIKPKAEESLFNPNSVLTWKTIYRKVDALMLDIQNKQGISDYRYEGDQDVKEQSQGVINLPSTIAQGQYLFNLYFAGISNLREVKVTGIATKQGIALTVTA